MLHNDNPLKQGLLDEEPDDVDVYGYDAQGPSCLGEDNNVVVVEPIHFEHTQLIEEFVLANLDPLKESSEMGVDIYCDALAMVIRKSEEISSSGF